MHIRINEPKSVILRKNIPAGTIYSTYPGGSKFLAIETSRFVVTNNGNVKEYLCIDLSCSGLLWCTGESEVFVVGTLGGIVE